MKQYFKGIAWIIASFAIACAVVIYIPKLSYLVPWKIEARIAASLALDQCPNSVSPTPAQRKAMRRILHRIYPLLPDDLRFDVAVGFSRDTRVNAYALPGGMICVHTGLLAEARSAEEIAAIIAHEIEHERRRHLVSRVFFIALLAMLGQGSDTSLDQTTFSADQEQQADEGALVRLQAGAVSNDGFAAFLARRAKQSELLNLLSDHPSNKARLKLVREYPSYESRPILTQKEWEALHSLADGR